MNVWGEDSLEIKEGDFWASICKHLGAQESDPPPGWETIPGLLKRLTNTGSELATIDCLKI